MQALPPRRADQRVRLMDVAQASGESKSVASRALGGAPDIAETTNDWCALGVLRATARIGVRVPDQLSVIGFDNTHIGLATTPPLSSYRPRFVELGQRAASLLVEALRQDAPAPQHVRIGVDFVSRGSCVQPSLAGAPLPGLLRLRCPE